MSTAITDEELVKSAQGGDADSFAELVRRHHSRIIGFCASFLRDATAAQDAAQDVFVKAYGALARFRGDSQFTTWMYTICHRHCLDIFRREKRRRAESWDALVEEQGDRIEGLLRKEPSSFDSVENKDLIQRALASLKEEYRHVLLLREEQGLTYGEISKVTGWSIDSVKARLKRARKDVVEKTRHILGKTPVQANGGEYESHVL